MKKSLWLIAAICFFSFNSLENLQEDIQSYVLQENHPLVASLDKIFDSLTTLDSIKTLKEAHCKILEVRPSTLVLAKHPALPGYLMKLYLHSSLRTEEEKWRNLLNRCRGAENIRKLIQEKGLRHFTVPDKWIYITKGGDPVLIATYMDIVSKEESKYIWKNSVTKEQIKELYTIISHGYASTLLPHNIPYTKSGTFACIDTEVPKRVPKYSHAKAHLSDKMGEYWDKLVKNH